MTLIEELIKIASLSSKETKLKDFVLSWAKKRGLPIRKQGRNLLIFFKGQGKKALILNAHLDTVSAGDASSWQTDPLKPVRKNGRIYGLGASDEKASVASLLLLAERLNYHLGSGILKTPWVADVFLSLVVQEETDAQGTQDFLKWFKNQGFFEKYQEIAAVVCEPNSLERIELGHKGCVFIKLTSFGDSCHGSEPEKIKTHSIWQILKASEKLQKAFKRDQAKFTDPILGKPTLACLTAIKAGDLNTPNKFSDKCEATFDLRTSPKLHQTALAWFQKVIGTSDSLKAEFLYPPCSFAKTEKNEKIVKVAEKILPKAKLGIFKGACDLCYFTQAGIPGIILGPGERDVIHQANEYVKASKIKEAAAAYEEIIRLWH